MNIRKKIITFLSIVSILTSLPLNASAVNDTAITSSEETTEIVTEFPTETPTKTQKAYSFSENTIGNSDLVASQEVITENGQYQFIAVKTRSGDIFYIIIDKLKSEDNVYFLNEVDTYDINLLLSNDENNNTNFSENISATESVTETEITTKNGNITSNNNNSNNGNLLLIGGIVILGAIGFVIFKLKNGGFKLKKNVKEDVIDDEFYEDEIEINEDEE